MEELLDYLSSSDIEGLKNFLEKISINGEVPGTDGFTPLHVVAGIDDLNEKESVMSFLLENGADPNAVSKENLTPVHIAAMWNRCFQLEKMLQYGGDPWKTDDENRNCFDMAFHNHCYEAYQLLNIYLSEGKLNSKPKAKESRKIMFTCPAPFSTPKYLENSMTYNLKNSPNLTFMTAEEPRDTPFASPALFNSSKYLYDKAEHLNNSVNCTFMTANESKHIGPVSFSTPNCLENSKIDNLNCTSNFTFMSAKENFPLIFSSNDESEDYSSDASEFIKKLTLSEQHVKTQENGLTDAKQDECVNTVSSSTLNEEKTKESEVNKNYLNKAYIFSSSSETSETVTSDLNESNDSNYDTIVDSTDNSGIILIEMKSTYNNLYSSNASVCSIPNDWKSYHNVSSDCSTLSYCSSHSKSSLIVPDDLQKYSNSKIFQELKNIGDNPGPVLDHTRHVYLHRLARLISGCAISCELPKPKYCPEMYLFLENKLDMCRAHYLEQNIEEEFDAETSKEWREGNQRCCFNYFLLDPRITQNLPQRASYLTTEQVFLAFLDALFYVGKGTRGRPYSHLFEAAKSLEDGHPRSDKVNHILDIWDAGLGVISLHCFHNSIPVEAYTREACVIEAVGLDNLTNIRKGDFYGLCAKLTSSRKRLIGISLLHKALQIFLLEGERLIKPKDIRKK